MKSPLLSALLLSISISIKFASAMPAQNLSPQVQNPSEDSTGASCLPIKGGDGTEYVGICSKVEDCLGEGNGNAYIRGKACGSGSKLQCCYRRIACNQPNNGFCLNNGETACTGGSYIDGFCPLNSGLTCCATSQTKSSLQPDSYEQAAFAASAVPAPANYDVAAAFADLGYFSPPAAANPVDSYLPSPVAEDPNFSSSVGDGGLGGWNPLSLSG